MRPHPEIHHEDHFYLIACRYAGRCGRLRRGPDDAYHLSPDSEPHDGVPQGKVIGPIGSFTKIRSGHVFPDLIKQAEHKPIRVFLQDGVNDNRGMRRGGRYGPKWDWHAQNILMVEALTEKKYDVNYVWGIGTHSNKQGGAIMPEMLRWLWRDYPRKDDPKDPSNRTLLVTRDAAKSAIAH